MHLSSSPISIGIVIANYYTPKDTEACIESVLNADHAGLAIHILVIDNSEHGSPYSHRAADVYSPAHNIGLGGAWALGYERMLSKGVEYCMFLNSDAILTHRFFCEIRSAIELYGDNVVLGPRIVYKSDPGTIWSRGGEIYPRFAIVTVSYTHLTLPTICSV